MYRFLKKVFDMLGVLKKYGDTKKVSPKDATVDKIGISHHPFTVDIEGSSPFGSTRHFSYLSYIYNKNDRYGKNCFTKNY